MNTINSFRETLAKVRRSVTTEPGETHPDLREAIEIFAARHAGGQRPEPKNPAVPPELQRYLTMVSEEAHRITDADIEQLKAAGYSEDAIFELTVCAAVGEGLARVERTLDLLSGEL